MDDLIRAGGIAPIFIGEIENVGEEIRYMLEWGFLAHKRPGAILALADRIVPMLDAAALAEHDVLIIGYIACGQNIPMAGLQVLVYENAVVDFETASSKEAGHGLNS